MDGELAMVLTGARVLFEHGAHRVWLCGSFSHGRHWDHLSDLDYAVVGLAEDRRIAATRSLHAITGRGIDVIPWEDAPANMRVQIYPAMVEVHRDGTLGAPARGPNPPVTGLIAPPPPRDLHGRRHHAVCVVLDRAGASNILDVGCGDGALAAALVARDGVRVTAIDRDPEALAAAAQRRAGLPADQQERLTLGHGDAADLASAWAGGDALVAVEVIEHLDEPVLAAFAASAFGLLRPPLVVLTTPNAGYNAVLPGIGHRHHDHRFEWTVDQMRDWAEQVAAPHGYTVALTSVGPAHVEYGAPSQLARFTRGGPR